MDSNHWDWIRSPSPEPSEFIHAHKMPGASIELAIMSQPSLVRVRCEVFSADLCECFTTKLRCRRNIGDNMADYVRVGSNPTLLKANATKPWIAYHRIDLGVVFGCSRVRSLCSAVDSASPLGEGRGFESRLGYCFFARFVEASPLYMDGRRRRKFESHYGSSFYALLRSAFGGLRTVPTP